MNDKIKAMLEAKCAILDCEEKQFMFLGLPSSNPNSLLGRSISVGVKNENI
jgi:hypothetical protein